MLQGTSLRASSYPLLHSGIGTSTETSFLTKNEKWGYFHPFKARGLSSLAGGSFFSPVPPGGPWLCRSAPLRKKRRVHPEGLEQSKSSARDHDCRYGRCNPTFLQNLSNLHGLTWGSFIVEVNLLLQGPITKKIPFACPSFPLGPCAGTSLASACKPQCIQTSLVQHYILVFFTPLTASPG